MYMTVVCVLCVYDLCNCGMYVYIVYVCVYGMRSIMCVVYVHGAWCVYVTMVCICDTHLLSRDGSSLPFQIM